MVNRNITSPELTEFMARWGVTFYGLPNVFGFTQQTSYRWKKRIDADPDATLNSQFMCARVVKMEIKILRDLDEMREGIGERTFYEEVMDLPASDRPAAIRKKLDEIIYQ